MALSRNQPQEFDPSVLSASINVPAVHRIAEELANRHLPTKKLRIAWILKAVQLIDLTTLSGDDSPTNVDRLCAKGKHPLGPNALEALRRLHQFDASELSTPSVCVYPAQVATAVAALTRMGVYKKRMGVASVATGFPTGQYVLASRLEEVRRAVADGATEIDMVVRRDWVLQGNFQAVYEEVRAVRDACGGAKLKVILSIAEIGSYSNVYRASMTAMMAGADFIKTSTGKESLPVFATLPVCYLMMRAIREYYRLTGHKVGFKPAGGMRTAKDALQRMALAFEILGEDWVHPSLLRLGASSLLGDLEKEITTFALGRAPGSLEMALG